MSVVSMVYFLFRKNLIRSNGNRKYLKWKQEEINSADSLMVASTALLMHYGIIADTTYTPKKLAEEVHSVGNIAAANRNVQFDGFYDYDEETLKQFFNDGHPCAVRAVINEMDKDCWLPVMYLDDDGGVVWNPYSGEPFLAQFHRISEICCFTVFNIRGESFRGKKLETIALQTGHTNALVSTEKPVI